MRNNDKVQHPSQLSGTQFLTLGVLGDAYFVVPVHMFFTAGRKYFRARIRRTLNFAWGRINITDCLQPQIRQRVSVYR
jgi:hypothetical protein